MSPSSIRRSASAEAPVVIGRDPVRELAVVAVGGPDHQDDAVAGIQSGMKIFVHPEYPMIVWASRLLKRTVKWIPDRQEAFQSDVQGRDHVSKRMS